MIGARIDHAEIRQLNRVVVDITRRVFRGSIAAAGRSAEIYNNRVRHNIGTHPPEGTDTVYGETWQPLSKGWLEKKESTGGIREKWAYTGEIGQSLVQSVEVRGHEAVTFAGIDGGRTPEALRKAIKNEFGLYGNRRVAVSGQQRLPGMGSQSISGKARPLFMPVMNAIREEFVSGGGYVFDAYVNALQSAVTR